ncbi:Riboflavin transporter [Aliiroseovarius sp. xm-m-379]|uniref:DMT family transporter n=1 Tax=unclassified Aliiroseovarius TaxID=2623558 RepID=UPI001567F15D|nr:MULTISPECIES: DMT family transporter [unclassified Aliiroseovarius]NRP12408.1 Riboflavin transporter [Aliiroseovarius sp. xm-d-517]NRP24782.1 Riboflavin transporter [Aliiroseovarius sp. xm-m-379]NRP30583.1 Riboflavin transporter [Aliiroseovarius sp. xm-m-314]NRP33581.1 Riboflavin transporter [Aliiroseovarius sp. xm-a-104]NRP40688.1 Riboflavin transporter [Aliiroseovarius sp. xm-m-339-2]
MSGSVTSPTTHDRPFLGILLMLGFCMLVPLSDAQAKALGGEVALLALITLRFLFPLLLYPWLKARNIPCLPPKGTRIWMLARALVLLISMGLMYQSLRFLPLADAVAIAFVAPFIMLALGALVLGEQVGPHRIGAALVGFIGTLLVIQPNFVAVGLVALMPLGVALGFAIFAMITRKMSRAMDPLAIQVANGSLGAVILLPLWGIAGTGALPPLHLVPDLVVFGVIGTASAILMTASLKYAPSATLAPMQYLEIPFATLIGWLAFHDLPNGLAALGIAITVAAGLYVIAREHRQARRQAQSQARRPA